MATGAHLCVGVETAMSTAVFIMGIGGYTYRNAATKNNGNRRKPMINWQT